MLDLVKRGQLRAPVSTSSVAEFRPQGTGGNVCTPCRSCNRHLSKTSKMRVFQGGSLYFGMVMSTNGIGRKHKDMKREASVHVIGALNSDALA